MEEIDYCSKVMKKAFRAFNLNVEKIGNIIPQLHIHIIARNQMRERKRVIRGGQQSARMHCDGLPATLPEPYQAYSGEQPSRSLCSPE